MNLSALRLSLLDNPSKETLTEIVSSAQITNPVLKSMVYMALQTLKPADVEKFSKIAAVAIQYVEQGNYDGLKALCDKSGIPAPIVTIIMQYASNLPAE